MVEKNKLNKRIKWHLETWSIDKLKPYDKNPRIINESGLNQLKKSFDEIGFCQPININIDGTILSGHARFQQLVKEGQVEVEVYLPDRKLTSKQEEAVIIRMNKNIAGVFDFEILKNDFEVTDLYEWGFTAGDFPCNLDKEEDEEEPTKQSDKYILQVELPNELELRDLYDDLMSKGFMVKEI